MLTGRLVSIQVSQPEDHGDWRTSFFKRPVEGPVWMGRENLEGDRQADRRVHGGPDQAVLAYSADHYEAWRRELDEPDLPYGAFAENLTIAGLDENVVCVGDSYAIGEARVQVSRPRGPCWKIAKRWNRPDSTARVGKSGRTGWYLRVLDEGFVTAGDAVTLLERPYPDLTVAAVGMNPKAQRSE